MTFDGKLNDDNDLDFGANNIVTNLEKIKQQIFVRLKWFQEEWDYSPDIGVPYFREILGVKNPNLIRIFTLILTEIENIQGVITANIQDFNFLPSTRQLSIKFSIMTQYGNITLASDIL